MVVIQLFKIRACSKDLVGSSCIVSFWCGDKRINKLTDWYLWSMSHHNVLTRRFLSILILNNDRSKTRGCITSVNHLHQLVYRKRYADKKQVDTQFYMTFMRISTVTLYILLFHQLLFSKFYNYLNEIISPLFDMQIYKYRNKLFK